jgi:ribosome-binding ATPase YchF (GTP1/OBG family)
MKMLRLLSAFLREERHFLKRVKLELLINNETTNVFYRRCKKVRAWTIDVGSTAPQAAGVIHTDFEKDLFVPKLLTKVQYGSKKEAGKFKVEGKVCR